jgi:hypothetical protein
MYASILLNKSNKTQYLIHADHELNQAEIEVAINEFKDSNRPVPVSCATERWLRFVVVINLPKGWKVTEDSVRETYKETRRKASGG